MPMRFLLCSTCVAISTLSMGCSPSTPQPLITKVSFVPKPATTSMEEGSVCVNRVLLADDEIASLEARFQTAIRPGRYWYDEISGAMGYEGGPTEAFLPAGLDLGGPLPQDISDGDTGVIINRREIHARDISQLHALVGRLKPGEYWLDRFGNLGRRGQNAFTNLAQQLAILNQNKQTAPRGASYGSVIGLGGNVTSDGQGGTIFMGRGPGGEAISWYSGM